MLSRFFPFPLVYHIATRYALLEFQPFPPLNDDAILDHNPYCPNGDVIARGIRQELQQSISDR